MRWMVRPCYLEKSRVGRTLTLWYSVSDIEGAASENDKQCALRILVQELAVEKEQGMGRVIAIDSNVDRFLCTEILHYIPPASQEERNTLVLILQSLDLIWNKQSTTQRRKDSRVRGLEILPHLLTLWRQADLGLDVYSGILSILRSWSRMQDEAIKSLLIQAGIVDALSIPFESGVKVDSMLWPQCLGLIKDLIFRATSSEKHTLYEQWMSYILSALPMDSCEESATACLWNWAVDEDLALHMASNSLLWSTLTFCHPKFQSHGAQRNTLSCVGSILSVCTSKLHDNPFLSDDHVTWIVDLAAQAIRGSEDNDMRRRGVRTIRCLSMCPWGREILIDYDKDNRGLMRLLARVFSDYQEEDDTRVQVSLAINNLLPHLNEIWAQVGPQLEISIVKNIVDEKSSAKVVKHSLQVLVTCFEFSPWKRGAGCLSDAFFTRLAVLLKENTNDSDYHESIVALIHQLTIKTNQDTGAVIFENPKVVDVMALLLSDLPDTTAKAVDCIQAAVQASESKKHFVEHDLLLTNLVNVCIVSSGERKVKAKSLLVSLVADL